MSWNRSNANKPPVWLPITVVVGQLLAIPLALLLAGQSFWVPIYFLFTLPAIRWTFGGTSGVVINRLCDSFDRLIEHRKDHPR